MNEAKTGLELLERDFRNKLSDCDLIEIDFPEFGGSIYCRPVSSATKKTKCLQELERGGHGAFYAAILINYALDVTGKPLFKPGHKDFFMTKVDGEVLERVGDQVAQAVNFDSDSPENNIDALEVASKNSETTKISS